MDRPAAYASQGTPGNWPAVVDAIHYRSAADASEQPALFYRPPGDRPFPLLVALHSWSYGYRQEMSIPYAEWCIAHGWAFIHPDFRGPSTRPSAAGSDLVVGDILSAVAFAGEHAVVDERRIYLVGVSGGGMVALLMAGRAPRVWSAVSAWASISDLAAWHAECRARNLPYAHDLESACGGKPGDGPAIDAEYARRSPLTYLPAAWGLPLDINAGIEDGHRGSVPVNHALRAFNAVAAPAERFDEDQIAALTHAGEVPGALQSAESDPAYGDKPVLLRRTSGPARLTLFAGGHEIIFEAALGWLGAQVRA